ncbi:uncharacterized protein [Leuresthes tenuis]|uniref:uncharacterized protein isoform X2 n=1 Tax=Leuresthes tenuis TaxID=355514 RepID=UPI003B50F4E9
MDNLETPYEEEADFIECTACEKSLRGETLYKIHLTTPGHIKKEDVLVAQGLAVRKHTVPIFKDILQYLDYLKLDEPIIGLNFLDEVPNPDPQSGPKYMCRLCNQGASLGDMVCHVIGRKHRLKYVEEKRSDLVTWDGITIRNQGGKVMRAKAQIIERQDGRGTPKPMVKRGIEGKLNISRVPQRPRQNIDRSIPPRPQQDVPPLLPELKNYHRRKNVPGYPKTPAFHPDDMDMNMDMNLNMNMNMNMNRDRDRLSHDRDDKDLRRADYREEYREDYMNPDYHTPYGGKYNEEPQRRGVPDNHTWEQQDAPRYDYQEQMPHGQTHDKQYYPEEAPPYKRPHPERDPLQEFYSEEVRRRQVRSHEYQPSQVVYPKGDKQRWSLEKESGRQDGMNRAHRQESAEPEAKRRNLSTPLDGDRSQDHLFNIIQDYHHEMRDPYQEQTFDRPGPSRAGAPTTQRRIQVSSTISNIPEPFRRFLKGGANDEARGKRKSRFSDATPEELEMTKEIDGYGPSYPQTGGDHRAVGAPLRSDFNETQYLDFYGESESSHLTEGYHRGGSDSEGVFDMLKNIEIDNAEEADFLKSKLCSLLNEFKSKKMEKAGLDLAGMSKNYSDFKMDPQAHQYDRGQREDPDRRGPEDLDYNHGHRGGWKQHENIPEERHPEYHYPTPGEPRHSSRGRYEDEPPRYPKRFEEPMHPRDYQPAAEEFFDSHSSAPPPHMEQMNRMQRDPRYSNNLDKITSALLELVARK